MDYKEVGELDGISVRTPVNEGYRTCAVCQGDCEPDISFGADGYGTRIAFVCPEHGIQSLADPFEDRR